MKAHTTITLFCFVIVATLVTTSMAKNSNWGQRRYNDRLLLRTLVIKKSSTWRVTTHDIHFPGKKANNPYIITGVRAIDNKRRGGGYVQLRKGGPGFRYVTLHIKSKRNHSLNYTIEIYGR